MDYKESFSIIYDLQKMHSLALPHIYRDYASVDELINNTEEDNFDESYSLYFRIRKKLAGYSFLMAGERKHPSIYVENKDLILESFILDSKYRGLGLS